jgi:hypothetical protein
MKKLYLLILSIWQPLIVFSQADTVSIQTKTFPIAIVREIAKDLVRYDSVKNELLIVNHLVIENDKKLFLKDSLLFSYIEKEQKYKEIIKIQNEKYGILNDNYINNNNLLKKEKVKNTINQILIGLSIFGFTYSIIFK